MRWTIMACASGFSVPARTARYCSGKKVLINVSGMAQWRKFIMSVSTASFTGGSFQ
jgi:hypothetical protein